MKHLALLFICALLWTSCGEDDTESSSHLGDWKLLRISGPFTGVSCDYTALDVVYNFTDEVLSVSNAPITQDFCAGLMHATESTGYSIINKNGNQYLVVDGREQGLLTINNDTMLINESFLSDIEAPDGFITSLIRL